MNFKNTCLLIAAIIFNSLEGGILFKRENKNNSPHQNYVITHQTYKEISSSSPWGITFNAEKIEPFDNRGTCSAMALDFLARYINEAKNIESADLRKETVKGFRHYYQVTTTEFNSRQAAYNSIEVEVEPSLGREENFLQLKMMSLANFHGIVLTPASELFEIEDDDFTKKNFLKFMDELPDGEYLLRMTDTTRMNKKLEWVGHTVIFIKNRDLSIYYNNAQGAIELPYEKLGKWIFNEIWDYEMEYVIIYAADSENGVCKNLAAPF